MGNIKDYFSSVGKGITSLVKGMAVTGKEFVTPKVTECYPENRQTLKIADRFRAELTLIYDDNGRHKCIGCGICQMNCPNGTIQLTTKMVDLPDGKKKRVLDKYLYDLGSCTFCMLCVTTCPQDALEFTNDFEQAVFTRDKLIKQLNYRPEPDPAELISKPATPAGADAERLAKIKAEALAKAAKIKAEREAAAKAAQSVTPQSEDKDDKKVELKADAVSEPNVESKADANAIEEPKPDNNETK